MLQFFFSCTLPYFCNHSPPLNAVHSKYASNKTQSIKRICPPPGPPGRSNPNGNILFRPDAIAVYCFESKKVYSRRYVIVRRHSFFICFMPLGIKIFQRVQTFWFFAFAGKINTCKTEREEILIVF